MFVHTDEMYLIMFVHTDICILLMRYVCAAESMIAQMKVTGDRVGDNEESIIISAIKIIIYYSDHD